MGAIIAMRGAVSIFADSPSVIGRIGPDAAADAAEIVA